MRETRREPYLKYIHSSSISLTNHKRSIRKRETERGKEELKEGAVKLVEEEA